MNWTDGALIANTEQYRFAQSADAKTLLFEWKHIAGLGAQDFRDGIAAFAEQCRVHRASYAAIDAALLDPSSPAVCWLRGQDVAGETEDYQTWWIRDIVPVYHDAGVQCLAVGTGDPNAPGELPSVQGVDFRIGYFADIDAALGWRPG